LFKVFSGNIKPVEVAALCILAIAVFALYANTLNSSFHLDDERVIWNNPAIFMKQVTWDNLATAGLESKIRTRPVAHITFAFNYYFHHLDVRGYHVVNIIIHILTGILLFYLIKTTLSLPSLAERHGNGRTIFFISFTTAAIWLIHPIQTQSVTYIVQRMTSMAAMFYILSMLLYVKARLATGKHRKWALFAGCVMAGILSLGTKENSATLPFFIFLYEWYFLQQDMRFTLSPYKRQWFLLAGAFIVFGCLTLIYLGGSPVKSTISSYAKFDFTLTQKLLTEFRVVVLYVSLLFFPHPNRLNLDYDFLYSPSLFSPAATFFSVMALAGLAVAAVLTARKHRLLSFSVLWFLGNLVIESSFIPLELVFEHRTYLPSMFVILLIVATLYRHLVAQKYLLYGACIIILAISSYWTVERNKVWADELTLWQDCLEKSPNKWRVHNNLGKEYFRRWETDKAIYHYEKALYFRPNDIMPRMNLASALAMKKRYQEAIIQLQIVLNQDPGNLKARKHLRANQEFLKLKKK
jgi:hypothetical protein